MLNVKQEGIKYYFVSLRYDSTLDWTQVSRAFGEHSCQRPIYIYIYIYIYIGVAPSPTIFCSSYRKGSLCIILEYGRQLYFNIVIHKLIVSLYHNSSMWLYIYIYIYIGSISSSIHISLNIIDIFLSTYIFVNPFELPYWSYDIWWELFDKSSIIRYFPSTFCPTLGHPQGKMYYKNDITFVCALLLSEKSVNVSQYNSTDPLLGK